MTAQPDDLEPRVRVLVERLTLYLGHFQPDTSRLPDTAELARRFHASRDDIRSALLELQRRHIIRSGRNGWLYRTSLIHSGITWPRPLDPRELIDARGWQLRFRAQPPRERKLPAAIAQVLKLEPHRVAIYFTRVLLADGDPVAYTASWLHPDHATGLLSDPPSDDTRTLGDLLNDYGIDCWIAGLHIEIRPPNSHVARRLHLIGEPPTPEVTFVHHTRDDEPLAHTTTVVHPQYFRLTLTS
jgi:DNA-binding GntR family transcriptional regulator